VKNEAGWGMVNESFQLFFLDGKGFIMMKLCFDE
jgi:hypothetical protein